MLAGRKLAVLAEGVDQLLLPRAVRLDQLGQLAVGPVERGGGEQGADEAVHVGRQLIESRLELGRCRTFTARSGIEPGREACHAAGGRPWADRTLDGQLDLPPTHGHVVGRARTEKTYSREREVHRGLNRGPITKLYLL